MPEVEEFKKVIPLSIGAIVFWTTAIIIGTFYVATVFFQFRGMQHEVSDVWDQIKYNDDRVTKITARIEGKIDAHLGTTSPTILEERPPQPR